MNRVKSHAAGYEYRGIQAPPALKLDDYTAGGRAAQRGEPCVCRLRTRRRVQWIKGWRTAYADGAGE